jgi:ABC transport system ATP-binding/permease protein
LSTSAYLLAKICVFCVFAAAQSAIMTVIVLIGKGTPVKGAVVLGDSKVSASIELYLAIAGTCIASAIVGLVLSALARSSDQILPLLVVSIMSQVVLSGGMIPVTGRAGLDQLSWVMPGRWGYAASASTVGLPCPHFTPPPPCPAPGAAEAVTPQGSECLIPPSYSPQDSHWQHTPRAWLFDMGMLAVLSIVYAGFIRWRLRLKR